MWIQILLYIGDGVDDQQLAVAAIAQSQSQTMCSFGSLRGCLPVINNTNTYKCTSIVEVYLYRRVEPTTHDFRGVNKARKHKLIGSANKYFAKGIYIYIYINQHNIRSEHKVDFGFAFKQPHSHTFMLQ